MVNDRSKIIGGSDIAAIMGLSRWATPLSIWACKTGRIVNDLSNFEAAEIGTELEEYVARKFTRKTGIKLRVDNRTFKHTTYPYMVAHIDRWVVGDDSLFEAKTASAWKEKEWGGEDIPTEYVLQGNWYCGIVGKSKCHIAVLIGGQKFIWKAFDFDSDLFVQQVEKARDFWENFVLKDIPPMAMAGDGETMFELFPQATADETIRLEGEKALLLDELCESRAGGIESIKHAEEELDRIESQIKQILGEASSVEADRYSASWKNQTRSGVDIERMKADGVYEQYKKVTATRVLKAKQRGSK